MGDPASHPSDATPGAARAFLGGKVVLHAGDSRDVLKGLAADSIDAVVTDPPYALVSIGKRFGKAGAKPAAGDVYARAGAGFMGKTWDTGETAFDPEFWAEVLRVAKPGAHLVAFGGTRSYHRLACAIEDAGFEIRDQIAWTYGSGFPKSHNAGDGWGTALKPAWEPIVLARKPLIGTVASNVLQHGTGAINVDGCRVETAEDLNGGRYSDGKIGDDGATYGSGINLRSAADYAQPTGRWPANICHDGSPEVLEAFPESKSGRPVSGNEPSRTGVNVYGDYGRVPFSGHADSGSAARFFYTAKADADDRLGSAHPTVKPLDLMQWLVRLVTPKGGLVLDPFAGTGTTGEAAWREGMRAELIERDPDYLPDITRRMELALAPDRERRQRSHEARAARGKAAAAPETGLLALLRGGEL